MASARRLASSWWPSSAYTRASDPAEGIRLCPIASPLSLGVGALSGRQIAAAHRRLGQHVVEVVRGPAAVGRGGGHHRLRLRELLAGAVDIAEPGIRGRRRQQHARPHLARLLLHRAGHVGAEAAGHERAESTGGRLHLRLLPPRHHLLRAQRRLIGAYPAFHEPHGGLEVSGFLPVADQLREHDALAAGVGVLAEDVDEEHVGSIQQASA